MDISPFQPFKIRVAYINKICRFQGSRCCIRGVKQQDNSLNDCPGALLSVTKSEPGWFAWFTCVREPSMWQNQPWMGLGQLPQQRTGGLTSAVLSVAALAVKRCVGHDRQLWEVGVAGRRGGHVCMMLMVVTRCSSRPVVFALRLRTVLVLYRRIVHAHVNVRERLIELLQVLFQPFQESRAAQGPL